MHLLKVILPGRGAQLRGQRMVLEGVNGKHPTQCSLGFEWRSLVACREFPHGINKTGHLIDAPVSPYCL